MKHVSVALTLALPASSAQAAQADPQTTTFDQVHLILRVGDHVTVGLDGRARLEGIVVDALVVRHDVVYERARPEDAASRTQASGPGTRD
jgi:hypothetical protein